MEAVAAAHKLVVAVGGVLRLRERVLVLVVVVLGVGASTRWAS